MYALVMSIGFMIAFPLVGAAGAGAAAGGSPGAAIGVSLLLVLAPVAWLFDRSSPEAMGLEVDGGAARGDEARAGARGARRWERRCARPLLGVRAGQRRLRPGRLGHRAVQRIDPGRARLRARGLPHRAGRHGHHRPRRQLRRRRARRSRLAAARSCVVALLILTGALAALAHVTTVAHVMAQAVAMGIAGGFVMVVFFSFWGRAYGRAHLGRIQGAAQALTVLASAVGPAVPRACVDATGSYAAGFYALAGRGRGARRGDRGRAHSRRCRSGCARPSGRRVRPDRSSSAAWATTGGRTWPSSLGVATAVAVLAGALLVGDSVRGSLRDLVLQRLGARPTTSSCPRPSSASSWPTRLQRAIRSSRRHSAAVAPLDRRCRASSPTRRAGAAPVRCASTASTIGSGSSTASAAIAGHRAIATRSSAPRWRARSAPRPVRAILVRVQRPSEIPLESLHGRKDDLGRTLRLTVRAGAAGVERSASSRSTRSRATCAPCSCRWRACRTSSRSATASTRCCVPARRRRRPPDADRHARGQLEDAGRIARLDDDRRSTVGATAGLRDEISRRLECRTARADRSRRSSRPWRGGIAGSRSSPTSRTRLRVGDREIPYSLVTAIDLRAIALATSVAPDVTHRDIVLNRVGRRASWRRRRATLSRWSTTSGRTPGQLVTRSRRVPRRGRRADRRRRPRSGADVPRHHRLAVARGLGSALSGRPAPHSPGRRGSTGTSYRTTPKAFVPLEAGQRLWRSRYGAMTSIRVPAADAGDRGAERACAGRAACVRAIDPLARAWPCATCAPRAWPRRAARRTSASTSSTSASSSSSPRCCSRRCSSSSVSSSARARSDCCGRSASTPARAPAVPRRRARARHLGSALGRARRARVRVADHDGAAHLVGGRRGHHGADAARVAGVARWPAPPAECWRRSPASGGRCASLARISERSLLAGQLSPGRPGPAGRADRPLVAAIALSRLGPA